MCEAPICGGIRESTSPKVIDSSRLPRGPVSYKYIEVGKTLYQAPCVETPRFSAKAAYVMLRELLRDPATPTTIYDPFCGNGVLLVTALLSFASRVNSLLGSDLHPFAVRSCQMNLSWLREEGALQSRIQTIQAYQTEDRQLKAIYAERCRLMFAHARDIQTGTTVFQHDARRIASVLSSMAETVAIVTDPPYTRPPPGQTDPDFGLLEPFLSQVAKAPNVSCLMLCYQRGTPIRPLLERYFTVCEKRGTRSRNIYFCKRRPN